MTARPQLTLGIEEEYQVVDPESGQLRSFITQFIEDGQMVIVEREIKAELHQSMVELGTPVCATSRRSQRGAAAPARLHQPPGAGERGRHRSRLHPPHESLV